LLPSHGPGASHNGTYVLSEFKGVGRDRGGVAAQPVKLQNAAADYPPSRITPPRAIDGKDDTGWGVYGAMGTAHVRHVRGAAPVAKDAGGARAAHVLRRAQGAGVAKHTLGRFRISADVRG